MLRQLLPAISLLALSISVDALVLRPRAHTYSLPSATTSSLPITNLTSPTESSLQCENIYSCRTRYDIMQTCILTIFACVWVAVHPNIPPPKNTHSKSFSVWILDRLQPLAMFPVTLFFPELILGIAAQQNMVASKLCIELEQARKESKTRWAVEHQGDKETLERLATENNIREFPN